MDMHGPVQHLPAARLQDIQIILARSGEGWDLFSRGNLEVLDIFLKIRNADTKIIKGEGEVKHVGICSAIQLCPALAGTAYLRDEPVQHVHHDIEGCVVDAAPAYGQADLGHGCAQGMPR